MDKLKLSGADGQNLKKARMYHGGTGGNQQPGNTSTPDKGSILAGVSKISKTRNGGPSISKVNPLISRARDSSKLSFKEAVTNFNKVII